MRSIAHLDALIASIHARSKARDGAASARAPAAAERGAGGANGAAAARDVRNLLSASTRALLGLH